MQKPNFDKNKIIEDIIRVYHAGEYGAKRIYQGQIDFIPKKDQDVIIHMLDQEKEHLDYFEKKVASKKVRPTILLPLWHIGGYFMGAITAARGTKQAMICTEAVEEVIDKHYEEQKLSLEELDEPEMLEKIKKFQEDELDHMEIAKKYNLTNHKPIGYRIINKICHLAILLSKKF